MSDMPTHQRNWLQNLRQSPASRRPAETAIHQVRNMSPYEIINHILQANLKLSKEVYDIFIAKAKKEPEGPMKQHLRKQTTTIFKDYL